MSWPRRRDWFGDALAEESRYLAQCVERPMPHDWFTAAGSRRTYIGPTRLPLNAPRYLGPDAIYSPPAKSELDVAAIHPPSPSDSQTPLA